MDILRFSLEGKTAFFKKPDLNTYYSFTFGNIHKVALLGIFGAILGCKGYSDTNSEAETYPEFYDKLKNIEYSIVPKNEVGFINKKIQLYNNSVGYASKELGGNLIVKEQWLENPKWLIYVKLESEITLKLAHAIINNKCVYVPYLGKNDHPADINNAIVIKNCNPTDHYERLDSLFVKGSVKYGDLEDFKEEHYDAKIFKYEESLPVGLEEKTNLYYYDIFVNTNIPIEKYHGDVYAMDGKNIVFN